MSKSSSNEIQPDRSMCMLLDFPTIIGKFNQRIAARESSIIAYKYIVIN